MRRGLATLNDDHLFRSEAAAFAAPRAQSDDADDTDDETDDETRDGAAVGHAAVVLAVGHANIGAVGV